jgi:hypothetical protein
LQPFWDEHDKLVDKHDDLVKRKRQADAV